MSFVEFSVNCVIMLTDIILNIIQHSQVEFRKILKCKMLKTEGKKQKPQEYRMYSV